MKYIPRHFALSRRYILQFPTTTHRLSDFVLFVEILPRLMKVCLVQLQKTKIQEVLKTVTLFSSYLQTMIVILSNHLLKFFYKFIRFYDFSFLKRFFSSNDRQMESCIWYACCTRETINVCRN